jgi:hypothetical protein
MTLSPRSQPRRRERRVLDSFALALARGVPGPGKNLRAGCGAYPLGCRAQPGGSSLTGLTQIRAICASRAEMYRRPQEGNNRQDRLAYGAANTLCQGRGCAAASRESVVLDDPLALLHDRERLHAGLAQGL